VTRETKISKRHREPSPDGLAQSLAMAGLGFFTVCLIGFLILSSVTMPEDLWLWILLAWAYRYPLIVLMGLLVAATVFFVTRRRARRPRRRG